MPARKTLARGARIAVSVGLMGVLLLMADLGATQDVLAAARVDLVVLMFASVCGERLLAAYRWLVVARVGVPWVRYGPLLRLTFVTNFIGTFLPGSVGTDVLRVYGLARMAADVTLALGSVMVERLSGLVALGLLLGLGLASAPLPLPANLQAMIVAALAADAGALGALLHPRLRATLWRALALRLPPALGRRLAEMARRLAIYGSAPGTLAWSLLLGLALLGLRLTSVVIGAAALGIAADPLLFAVVVPVAILAAMLPVSMGGLGPREASYVALLGLAGVAPEAALVLALLREALNLAATLPGAVLYAQGWLAPTRS